MSMEKLKISLAAARINAGFTQKDAAEALEIGKCTLLNWEKGRTEPKTSQARVLSKLYKIPLDNIFLPIKSN